jgi:hypothetical protein
MRDNFDAGHLIIILVIWIEAGLIFAPHANLAPELLGRVMGTLDALAMLIAGFKWGSSQGSKDKTLLLAQANALPAIPAPDAGSLSQPTKE